MNIEAAVQEARSLASSAAQLNNIKGLKEDPALPNELSASELLAFGRTFNKSLRMAYQTGDHQLAGIFARHKIELMLGLLIAKKQIEGIFGGTDDGKAGILAEYNWRPAFWGINNDGWRGATPTTSASPQNMIHAGATVFGGSAGNDIQFLENVVFVVLGYANHSQDYPRVVALQERIDTAPQPVLNVGPVWQNNDGRAPVKYFELDSPRILKEDSKFRLQTLAEATVPASEWIYPIGVMYTKASLIVESDIASQNETYLLNHGIVVET